ncbi:MAG: calcium/sodium antiporter [Hyphomicrobiaceae bacterium]
MARDTDGFTGFGSTWRAGGNWGFLFMVDALLLLTGFVVLLSGGELLVRGSVRIAQIAGMSPLLIGLTLVGFGTSAPELVTSVQAAMAGSPGIAIGNIVGSNIANIMLILGVAAALSPMLVATNALYRDGMIVLLSAIIFNGIGIFLPLSRPVGAVLLMMLLAYLYYAYRQERTVARPEGHTAAYDRAEAREDVHAVNGPLEGRGRTVLRTDVMAALLVAVGGIVLVIIGGKLLVEAAVSVARTYNVSEAVIGLTIISVGTSMPELATSAVAAIRKHSDVALGNIMGSNLYNTFGIGGATGLLSPTIIPDEIVRYDNLVMLGATIAMLFMARTEFRLSRLEGLALLSCYAIYLYTLLPK